MQTIPPFQTTGRKTCALSAAERARAYVAKIPGAVEGNHNVHSIWPLKASSFELKLTLGAGQSAGGTVAIGDVDGDGLPDIVSGQYWRVWVYRNTSTNGNFSPISFEPPLLLQALRDILSVQLGDIDGDGKLDIVLDVIGLNTLCVFRNTSTLGRIDADSFAPKLEFETGPRPGRMALGDLDGDGKLDVAIPLERENKIEVRINRSVPGQISFAPPVLFDTDRGPLSVDIADLDGDGRPDLVSANYHSSVSILRNVLQPPASTNPPARRP